MGLFKGQKPQVRIEGPKGKNEQQLTFTEHLLRASDIVAVSISLVTDEEIEAELSLIHI